MAHRALWITLVVAGSTAVAQDVSPAPPPLVSVEDGDQAPLASPQRPAKRKERVFDLALVAAGSLGITDSFVGYTTSLRAELDIGRVGIGLAFNHFSSPAWVDAEVNELMGLVGYSVYSGSQGRFRFLAGVDIAASSTALQVGPCVGVNTRLGMGLLGVDAAAMLTPVPFRQLEARVAGVLKLLILEVHVGWRLQMLDASMGGSFATFSQAPSVNGPYLGVGIRI